MSAIFVFMGIFSKIQVAQLGKKAEIFTESLQRSIRGFIFVNMAVLFGIIISANKDFTFLSNLIVGIGRVSVLIIPAIQLYELDFSKIRTRLSKFKIRAK